jgi:hypothetical protein
MVAVRGIQCGLPLPRPADRYHQRTVAGLHLEERKVAVGRPPAAGPEDLGLAGLEHDRGGLEVGRIRGRPFAAVETIRLLPAERPIQGEVKGLDVFNQRRILSAGVLEEKNPLQGRKTGKPPGLDSHPEPAHRVSPGPPAALHAVCAHCGTCLRFPAWQQLVTPLATHHEREGELCPAPGRG